MLVQPDDRPLMSLVWRGRLYIDTVLPFGLQSVPNIFNALADLLEWGLSARYILVLHYVLLFGRAESGECEMTL